MRPIASFDGGLPSLFLGLALVATLSGGCSVPKMLQEPFEEGVYEDILERQAEGVAVDENQLKDLPAMTAADYERLGDTYLSRGQIGLARVKYSKALELDPSSWLLQYKIGTLFLKQGAPADALLQFRSIVVADPANARGHEGEGRALLALKDYEAAEAALLSAVQLDPTIWKAHEALGVLYDDTGRLDEAVQSYKRALEIRPAEASVLNNLGVAYYLRKDYPQAIATLKRALPLSSEEDRRRVLNNLGRAYAQAGDYSASFESFRKGSDVSSAYNSLGLALLQQNNPRRAAACFQKAIETSTRHNEAAVENRANAMARIEMQHDGPASGRVGGSCL